MLDVSKWKFFRLGDYFEVKKGKRLTKEDQTEGLTPYLGAIDSNNGVASLIGQEPIHDGNTISLSYNGSVGEAFYQPVDYWSTDDVNALYPKDIPLFNARIGLFVCTILRQEKYRYSYGRKWVLEEMENALIKLPAISNETPDWKFMERYMKCLENQKDGSGQTIVKSLQTKNVSRRGRVETLSWNDFELGEIFDQMYKAEAHVKSDMLFAANKSCDALEFVSRTEDNNGCDCIVSKEGLVGVEKGNAIIIGDTTATMFYQRNDFVAGDHIVVCRSDWMNKYRALFLISVVARNKYRYCYGRAFKMDLIKATRIRLPVTPFGEPDWAYMEKYIRSLPYGDRI